ncbi:DUF1499 domain-containing protein [Roseiterribacter gracilis]|uniref:DUF1499 domain-containing protein n=1 Tax=Roseiterribacter gracilis TaxID=2812848 RepID=A0A8S8XG37_9PROT|nr:hypothetical protein TMPK1_31690 [Rhodospirillales bacterium TMPK1]
MQTVRLTRGTRILAIVATLGLVAALVALLMLGGAPLVYRTGMQPLPVSFLLLRNGVYVAGAAALLSLIGLIGIRRYGPTLRRLVPIAFVVSLAIGVVPFTFFNPRNPPPPIHDITTDMDNPPVFVAVLPLREAAKAANPVAYNPDDAKVQKAAYADIVPMVTKLPPAEAFNRAASAARAMGWTMVAQDSGDGRIEASDTTFWFGFTDDVVIRVTAQDGGSRIDIRSLSRIGRGDVGANAKRIRAYEAKLKDALG